MGESDENIFCGEEQRLPEGEIKKRQKKLGQIKGILWRRRRGVRREDRMSLEN